jgi:pimeloyl-ACP methyl ester carboxylesterase
MKMHSIVLLIVLSVVVVFIFAVWITSDKSPIGHWNSDNGRIEYKNAYDAAMKIIPPPTSTDDIATSFGTVRVYTWANEKNVSKTPIVLFPGRTSGTPMWSMNIGDFLRERTVYALDALGDAGMSVQSVRLKDSVDQAQWIDEVFTKMHINKVHAIGHSFGGWLVANYASRHPEKIASIVLLEPAFTFQPIKMSIVLKSIPYSIPFFPKVWKEGLLQEIASTKDIDTEDPVAKMIVAGSKNYLSKLPAPDQITIEQMKKWNFPVYCAFGGKSSVHDSSKALETAQKNVKNCEGKIWEDGTHSLPMEYASAIDKMIIEFLERVGT